MLRKELRLRYKKEFAELKEKGTLMWSPLFGLVYLKSDEGKFGWIVSKKISKKAVERNRIRRLLAEVVGKNWIEGYKVLFLAKKEILGKKLVEIEEEYLKIIKKIK